MRIKIRQNSVLTAEISEPHCSKFMNLVKPALREVQKNVNSKADIVYKTTDDCVITFDGDNKMYLWKDDTVIAVFI